MPEEAPRIDRPAGVFPEQLLTEANLHRDAVVSADQRAVTCCLGDDLAGFVHYVSHVPSILLFATVPGLQDVGHDASQSLRRQSAPNSSNSALSEFDDGLAGRECIADFPHQRL
jgi:hypothetical protein